VAHLRDKYGAELRSMNSWFQDFMFMMNAKRIVLAVSTFSW
jgi:hypothetical protein